MLYDSSTAAVCWDDGLFGDGDLIWVESEVDEIECVRACACVCLICLAFSPVLVGVDD